MIPFPAAFAAGSAIFLIVLWDAFEAIILPRRVTRKFRLTRLFFKTTWGIWRAIICLLPARKTREALLGFYGPLSLLLLVAVWAIGLVFGFGLMQYGAGSAVSVTGGHPSFATDVYLSGTTFFTLGLGDVVPRTSLARVLVVSEAGFGFGFLAAIVTEMARRPSTIFSRIGSAGAPSSWRAISLIPCSPTFVLNTTINPGSPHSLRFSIPARSFSSALKARVNARQNSRSPSR